MTEAQELGSSTEGRAVRIRGTAIIPIPLIDRGRHADSAQGQRRI